MSNFAIGVIYYLDINKLAEIDIYYYYIPQIIFGFGGTNYNFFLTIFSYIGDLSSLNPSTRIQRFTMAEASVAMGVISGYYIGSLVVQYLGDFYIFVFCSSLCLVAFLYGIIRIRNIIPGSMDDDETNNNEMTKEVN